jgi:outer membrane beta-barrel protein
VKYAFKATIAAIFLFTQSGNAFAQKSTEGSDVVMNKIYPKKEKFELNLLNVGFILNQAYVETLLFGVGANYYFSEVWGVGADITFGNNTDKPERDCIENFYNDPFEEVGAPCGDASNLDGVTVANYGPAYVPIREINNMIIGNILWNPIYGKQLVFMNSTSYFDLFLEAGLGLANSTFYPKQETLKNTFPARGAFDENQDVAKDEKIGADASETGSYGTEGRPEPESQSNVLINLGVGQKLHFAKRFHIRMDLRNITLLGTSSGFENLFVLFAGAGMRF